jgi:hypothetical protein
MALALQAFRSGWKMFSCPLTFFVVVSLFSGCGAPYKQIGPDIYQVSSSGSQYTSLDRVRLNTWLRCANLTIEKGGDYFVELDEKMPQQTVPTVTTAVGPHGYTYFTPSTYHRECIINIFAGEKPTDFPGARNARAVKAEKPCLRTILVIPQRDWLQ